MKDKYNLRCSKCGSNDVYVAGDADWSVEEQRWYFVPNLLSESPDESFRSIDDEASCGGRGCMETKNRPMFATVEWVKVGSDRDKELITIDGGNQS